VPLYLLTLTTVWREKETENESIFAQLNRELDEHGLSEEEKKEILRELLKKYALLILESANIAVKRSVHAKGAFSPQINVEDIRLAAEIVGVTNVKPEIIKKARDEAAQWLLKEGPDGTWGWGSKFDPQDLEGSIVKTWSTAMAIKSLLRAKISPEPHQIKKGVVWLLENRISEPHSCWARLPPIYKDRQYGDCLKPNTYETSCVLLALLEAKAKEVSSCDKSIIEDGIENLKSYQMEEGYWTVYLTDESQHYDKANIGATSLALTAISRARKNGIRVDGLEKAIEKTAEWLRNQQNPHSGEWSEIGQEPSNTAKTCDAIRALIEIGDQKNKKAINRGIHWLLRNQGVEEDGRGWGWRKTSENETIIASNVENTAFAITVLLRADKKPNSASIQTGLRWLFAHKKGDNWGEYTPRVIIALSEYLTRLGN